jgi:hypothetical protein
MRVLGRMVPAPFFSSDASSLGVFPSYLLQKPCVVRQLKAFHQGVWFGKHQMPVAPVGHQRLVILFISGLSFTSKKKRENDCRAQKNLSHSESPRKSHFHFHPRHYSVQIKISLTRLNLGYDIIIYFRSNWSRTAFRTFLHARNQYFTIPIFGL